MADLFVISPGLGKVYRFDGSTWSEYAAAPVTWPTTIGDPDAMLFVHRGKIYAFVTFSATRIDLFRLDAGGTWTSILTGTARTAYQWFGPALRYRGKVYVFMGVHPAYSTVSHQIRLLEWNGAALSGDNAATGLWIDRWGGSVSGGQGNRCRGIVGRAEAWRERFLLGQWVQNNRAPVPTLECEHSNTLFAVDPDAGAVVRAQQYLGGPDGDHAARISFMQDGTNDTLTEVIFRHHLGFGTYQGRIYVLGVDGGVRELLPSGIVTETPIFSFKSAFAVQGPYTTGTYQVPEGLGLLEASGGYLVMRNLLQGAEITCEGRVGIVTGYEDVGTHRVLRLRDPTTGGALGNFTVGASYTFKQGLGYNADIANVFYGMSAQAFFHEYNGKLYVLICGAQQGAVAGTTCPSILACWNGITASFTTILHAAATLDAAGANVHVDQAAGVMHIVYYSYLSTTSVAWKHVMVDLTSLAVLSAVTVATETGWSSTGFNTQQGLGSCASTLFTFDRPTAEVTGISYNALTNLMTVTYSLFDDNSDPANVAIETDFGAGWFEATRKVGEGEGKTGLTTSPSGVSHTFVHNLVADGSPTISRIQYRVIAVQAP